jgi:UDP-GlcNAc:undecaprenyl-phosphate GlcNAc-1-phosphate transferase
MLYFLSFIAAMLMTMLLIPPLIKTARQFNVVDLPGQRKVHTTAIPRIGGIAMVVGASLPILLWLKEYNSVLAFISGVAVISFFGILDDKKDLDYRIKFIGQTLAALIVIVVGNTVLSELPMLEENLLPAIISVPITLAVILGTTNAVNFSDGLDGLAGGLSLLSFGLIAAISYQEENIQITLISIAILGSILGFLRYNTYPANVFMGDAGSQFLGFSLGALSIMLTQGGVTVLSKSLPLMILGLPILDTLMVIVSRLKEKRSPFSADKNHIHHKLLAIGLTHYEAVFVIYILQSIFVVTAYLMRYHGDIEVFGVYVLYGLVIFSSLHYANLKKIQLRHNKVRDAQTHISTAINWLTKNDNQKISNIAVNLTAVLIGAYLATMVLSKAQVPSDIGYLALIVTIFQFVWLFISHGKQIASLDRLIIYVLLAISCFMSISDGYDGAAKNFELFFYILLATIVILGFRFAHNKSFKLTTLDFLVVFTALVVPSVSADNIVANQLGEFLAKLIVLFYATELILTQSIHNYQILSLRVGIAFFAIIYTFVALY